MEKGIAVVIIFTLLSGVGTCLNAQKKSAVLALGLSFGAPLAVWGLTSLASDEVCVASIVVAPSAGHFYADQWGRGLLFTGLRGGFIGLSFWKQDFVICPIIISVIDIVYVPDSVLRYNESHRNTGKVHFTPYFDPWNEEYGIHVAYRF